MCDRDLEGERVIVTYSGPLPNGGRDTGVVDRTYRQSDVLVFVVDLDGAGEAHVTRDALTPIEHAVDGREHVSIGKVEALLEDVERWREDADRSLAKLESESLFQQTVGREGAYGAVATEIRDRFGLQDDEDGVEVATDGGQDVEVAGDSHASRNADHLRQLKRQTSLALIRTHRTIVGAVEDLRGDDVDRALVDDQQLDVLDDATDQLKAVANAIAEDDRIHDERLLAGWSPGGS